MHEGDVVRRMPFLGDEVAVRQRTDETWVLLERLAYEGRLACFVVPPGFTTDFASVPRLFTWLVPGYGRYTRAAVLHDFLCVRAREATDTSPPRHDADGIFRRSMRELGVSFLRRWTMWAAVRFRGGWRAFWAAPARDIMQSIAIGLIAAAFLLIPTAVIAVWWLAAYALEWLTWPLLRAAPSEKVVNAPRLLGP